jgi:hypothetical protein
MTPEYDAILVGGLDDRAGDYNIIQQIELFKKGFGSEKKVLGLRYVTTPAQVLQRMAKSPKVPVILFSKGNERALGLVGSELIDKAKLFLVEPYTESTGVKTIILNTISRGVPVTNVYAGPGAARGGAITGASKTPTGVDHWGALSYVGGVVKQKVLLEQQQSALQGGTSSDANTNAGGGAGTGLTSPLIGAGGAASSGAGAGVGVGGVTGYNPGQIPLSLLGGVGSSMGWDLFKRQVKLVMESPPASFEVLAYTIATAYDAVIKMPPAGDLMNKNPVLSGNVLALENQLKLTFLQQSNSIQQLPIFDSFANGLVQYWGGATLQPLFPPLIPVPGAVANILPVVQVIVTNPGPQILFPFTYEGLNNVDGFIDKFILLANLHLSFVSGLILTTATFPGGAVGIGVGNWTGYSMTGNLDLGSIDPSKFVADDAALARLAAKFRGIVNPSEIAADLQLAADNILATTEALGAGGTGEGGGTEGIALSESLSAYITDTPWSAAFISYVMLKSDVPFPARAAHTQYLNALKSYSNFVLLDPAVTNVQIGDLVVFNRQGNTQKWKQSSWSGFSHGDIIVSLSSTQAKAIGGNVGNTVKESTFSITDGKLTSARTQGDVFAIARPLQRASNIVNTAKLEHALWSSNGWKELNGAALPKLSEYYKAANINLANYA